MGRMWVLDAELIGNDGRRDTMEEGIKNDLSDPQINYHLIGYVRLHEIPDAVETNMGTALPVARISTSRVKFIVDAGLCYIVKTENNTYYVAK